jgi:hypothetical protein
VTVEQVEADLRADAAGVPGALEKWERTPARRRERWIHKLLRGEAWREQFEALLSREPGLLAKWQGFPVTEQREFLASIDYLRFGFFPAPWAMRRAAKAVLREG